MTKEITQLTPKAIGVTVPVDAHSFYLIDAANKDNVQGLFWENDKPSPPWIVLPDGNYSILGLGDKLSEEQWKEVLEGEEVKYAGISVWPDYTKEHHSWEAMPDTAKESGLSLLKSLSLTPETTLILIKH